MKKSILFAALGLLVAQLMTACNHSDDTSGTGSSMATNSMSTNAPAPTH